MPRATVQRHHDSRTGESAEVRGPSASTLAITALSMPGAVGLHAKRHVRPARFVQRRSPHGQVSHDDGLA
jgi:hypothetical protein